MAVTFTPTLTKVFVTGDRKEVFADIACTGTPTAGGDALTAVALGLDIEMDSVSPLGNATNVGGTSGAAVAVIHGSATPSTVNIVFLVQGTAGAANAMVAYTGATAGFVFRIRAVGKGAAAV